MTHPKSYIRKPNYYETDQMGIIHHSNYIRWFEESRTDYMEQIGYNYNKATECGIDFAVLAVSCNYKSMIRFGDTVEIVVKIIELSQSRMTVSYEVIDVATSELRAVGTTSHCYYDGNKKRPVSLKRELPELYALFETLVIRESK